MHNNTLRLAQGALIAAVYVVLTLLFAPISYGPLQVRIAEILTILPMFTFSAVPGLFIGCLLANLIAGAAAIDVWLGSLATLIGAALGYVLRRSRWLVPLPTVIANALIIPVVLKYGYGIVEFPYPLQALYIGIGEILGCFVLGELLATALLKRKDLLSFIQKQGRP